jgi:hypothetical protein
MSTKPIQLTNPVIAKARQTLADLQKLNLKSQLAPEHQRQRYRRVTKEAKSLLEIRAERERNEEVAKFYARQALNFLHKTFAAHDRARGNRISPSIDEQRLRDNISVVLNRIAGIS